MSLQVWLPMTKDLRQQGLSDVEVTNNGATFNSTGKLGGCYLFDGSNDYLVGTYEAGAEVSFAAWVNLPALPGGRHIFDARTSNGAGYQPMYLSKSSIQIGCSGSNYSSFTYTWVANTWYHICVTHNATEGKCYVNGILIGTSTVAKGTNCGTCNFTLGSRCNQSNYSNVKLNDVRIYDHCLSPMEVKRISQGLVLHYPLNREGWGQENLITQAMINAEPWKSAISGTYTIDGKTGWILSNNQLHSKSGNGRNNIFSGLTYEENTQYTISFKWRDDYRTDNKDSSLYIRFKYSDGTYSQVILPKNNYWKEEIMTSTAGKTVSAITTTYGNGGNLLFTDLKLEKGAIKTSTSPIVNSDLYNSMGLDSIIEYDTSGFCNNGTRTGTFSWTSDTPRYNVATYFDGSTSYIQLSNSLDQVYNNVFTISMWINPTIDKRGVLLGSYTASGLYTANFELYTGHKLRVHWHNGDVDFNTAAISLNVWTHIVFVKRNSSSMYIYKNGELFYTASTTFADVAGDIIPRIGKDYRTSGTNVNYKGGISDFRIYATALSADDVKNLYQNSAYISSNATTYAHEFVEE